MSDFEITVHDYFYVIIFVINNICCVVLGARGTLDGTCTADGDCSVTPHAGKCTDTDNDNTLDTCKCSTGYTPNTRSTSCIGKEQRAYACIYYSLMMCVFVCDFQK